MAIFTAIGAAAFGAGTFLATVTAAALQTAAGIALSYIGQSLSGKADKAEGFGVVGRLQGGGDIGATVPLGWHCTAGSLVYANFWGSSGGTPNAYLTQVICLADLPVAGLSEVWVNGNKVTLGTAHAERGRAVTEFREGGKDHLWIKFYDGSQTSADSFLVTRVGSTERPYGSTRVGHGRAYAIVTALVDDDGDLFGNGFPQFRFTLDGMRLYDPSRDDSVGGDGEHRWSDPTTWGGDGDVLPAVQVYNVLRGISYGGQWFYGLQNMAGAQLPVAHWIGQIEKCRASIEGPAGMEPAYRSGGEIPVGAPVGDALEQMLKTCQARLAETGGVYKIHLGAPDAPVASFNDGHILSTEPQSFVPFFGLADTVNGITAKHPSPAEGWTTKVAPPLLRTDLEVLAGHRRLLADVSLDLVPYDGQVQRLMKSALLEAQRARRHTFVLPPEFWVLEPGDVVEWTSARNGYEIKQFRIDGIADRANLDVLVDLTEIDPEDYDWDQEADYRAPVDGPVLFVRPAPQPILDWSAVGAEIRDSEGNARRAAIQLFWDGEQEDVAAVLFEVRLAETEEVVHRGRADEPAAGSILVSQNILPSETYQVRGKYVPISDRRTLWSEWLSVTTPAVSEIDLGPDSVRIDNLVMELRNRLELVVRDLPERIAALEAEQEAIASGALTNSVTFKRKVEVLRASAAGAIAAVIREQTARISDNEAFAMALTQVVAELENVIAAGLLKFEATAGEGGAEATISLMVRAGYEADFVDSGIFIKATADGEGGTESQILLLTDNLTVTDGVNTEQAFTIDAQGLKFLGARAGLITSLDGVSMRIDFDNEVIEMIGA